MNIQQLEEQEFGRDGIWYCGSMFANYEDAMQAAGGDTIESLQDEAKYLNEHYHYPEAQDDLETSHPTLQTTPWNFDYDEIPF